MNAAAAQVVSAFPGYKRLTAAVVLAMFGAWTGYLLLWPGALAAGAAGPLTGGPAPDFELKTVEGQIFHLSQLRGQVVMINFFATWCPPCRAEMPMLQEAYQEYRAQGFVILAVNLGESDVSIRAFQSKLGLSFPIVVDKNDQVSRLYQVIPLPTSFFVDRNGILRGKWTGEIGKRQLRTVLRPIL